MLRCLIMFAFFFGAGAEGAASPKSENRPQVTTVFIVRHAEKESESGDPPLSSKGIARVRVLQWMLRDVDLDVVYATDYKRTRKTVESVASQHRLDIRIYAPGTSQLADSIRNEGKGQTILIAGHSNTVPILLKQLGVEISDTILPGYDDLFVVTLISIDGKKHASLHRLHYTGRID